MPRPKRAAPGGYCYHVLNRGNARQEVLHKQADYAAFGRLFDEAQGRFRMRVLAYCLMPNHFHLVLWPLADGDLSRWMQWLQTTHVWRYHEHYRTSGHVWQGRFKAFPIEEDAHLLTVLRYVERNPLRAGLVSVVDAWPWSSLAMIPLPERPAWYSNGPVKRGRDWLAHVAKPQTDMELLALRRCVHRGCPYGGASWQTQTITALGLESTLRPRGRPRKPDNQARSLSLPFFLFLLFREGKAKRPLLYEVGGANAIERRSRRASTMLTIRAQVGPRRGSRGHPPEFASGRIAGQHQHQWSPLAYNAPHQITGGGMMAAQDPDQRKSKLEALWKEDRGDFLEEYRRVMGKSPGELRCSFTVASMVEQILAREFPLDPAR